MTDYKRASEVAKKLAQYTNSRGQTIQRLATGVLQMVCPNGCTALSIAFFVDTKAQSVTCPHCRTVMNPEQGVWGKFGVAFIPDSVLLRENIENLERQKPPEEEP